MSTATVGYTNDEAKAKAMALGAKMRRMGGWYVAEHRLRGMLAYLQTMIATSIGTPVLYLYALGVGLATLIDANIGEGASAVPYLVFVAPALLCSAALTTATEEFTYPILLGFKWNPIFFAINSAPISGGQIINGVFYAVTIRLIGQSIVYYLFMIAFGAIPGLWGWLTILTATVTGMAIGTILMAYTASMKEDRGQLAYIMRFGIIPLTLFSGTFFPLDTLPAFLHWIGWISPLWHGVELSRVLAYGYEEPGSLTAVHIAYLLALTIIGVVIARRVSARRLNK
ncbi:MAG: ABC transporter permease [Cryobacterium sp.]|nr:ABC transporter permease [Cryobacterium sp.]